MDLYVYRLLWVSNLWAASYIMWLSASYDYCHACLKKKVWRPISCVHAVGFVFMK